MGLLFAGARGARMGIRLLFPGLALAFGVLRDLEGG